ncbi:MAG TPA: hypothetical protein VJM12_11845 [Pyrinomonadaceae bacterium]|nr:hypothetical protein [Pyrinomonadaceae bacterium]
MDPRAAAPNAKSIPNEPRLSVLSFSILLLAVDCTEDGGVFEIDEIPFGSYFIVVNTDDKISAYQPFRRFIIRMCMNVKGHRLLRLLKATMAKQSMDENEFKSVHKLWRYSQPKGKIGWHVIFEAKHCEVCPT